MVGKLQERYGYSKDEVSKEVNKRLPSLRKPKIIKMPPFGGNT